MLARYDDNRMAGRHSRNGLFDWNAFHTDMDDYFARLFSRSPGTWSTMTTVAHPIGAPQGYRFEEDKDGMTVSMDLPGVRPADVSVSHEGNTLSIEHTLRGKKGSQSFTVRSDYDVKACTAKLEHGVLELRVPKLTEAKPKKVSIEVK
jgi:HSP20 family protein